MTDLADLGLRFHTEGDQQTLSTLDKVASKSTQAEKATDGLAAAERRKTSAAAAMLASIEKTVRQIEMLMRAQQQVAGATNTASGAMQRAAVATINYSSTFTQVAVGANKAAGATAAMAKETAELGATAVRTAKQLDMMDAHVLAFQAQAGKMPGIHAKGAAGAKLQAHEMLNLSRQFSDIGVTAAMGMNPLMILVQQGPQIAETLAVTSARGITLSMAMRQVAAAGWAMLAPLAPFLLAATAVATVVGGSWALATRKINEDHKGLINTLGLTHDQLEKVKNKTITMGDVLKGTFSYIGKAVGDWLSPVSKWFGEMLDDLTSFTWKAVKEIVGAFGWLVGAIKASWGLIPAALGDVMVSAANGVLGIVEKMLNSWVEKVNSFIALANAAAKLAGATGSLPSLSNAALPRLANANQGGAGNLGAAVASGGAAGRASAIAGAEAVKAGITASILDETKKRMLKEAGKAPKGAAAPRDQTDQRAAQVEQALAAAKREELEAQLALKDDLTVRLDIQKQIIASELAEKVAALDKQIAAINALKVGTQIDKAVRDELVAQLEAAKATYGRAALAKNELANRTAEEALARQALAQRETIAGYTDQIAQINAAMAGTAAEQNVFEKQALAGRQERERERLDLELKYNTRLSELEKVAQKAALGALLIAQDRQQAEQARVRVVNEEFDYAQLGLRLQMNILSGRKDVVQFDFERRAIEKQLLLLAQEEARKAADRAIAVEQIGSAAWKRAKLTREQLDEEQRNQRLARLNGAYEYITGALNNAAGAIKAHDWSAAVTSLFDGFARFIETLTDAKATIGQQIEALGGLVAGAGSLIGGSAGKTISSVGSGISAGSKAASALSKIPMIASAIPGLNIIAPILGGLGGLLGGIFGKSKAKREAEEKKAAEERDRQAKLAEQARTMEIETLKLSGQWLKASALARKAEFDQIDITLRAKAQDLYNLKLAAEFRSKFYTAEENAVETTRQLAVELKSLGLSADLTREQYKALVNQGGQLGAALLDLMEPFDLVTKGAEAAAKAIEDAWAETVKQAAIDTYVRDTLMENDRLEQERRDRLAWTKSDNGPSLAEQRAAAEAASTAWDELQGQLDAATASAIKAGDWFGALAAQTKMFLNDPANAAFVRGQGTHADGSFNAAGFNAMNVKIQARAAEQLLGTFQAISIKVPGAVKAMNALLDVMELANSPEFGGMGSAAGPVQGGGLYGALRRYAFVSSTTDSFGNPGTGYGKDVNDGTFGTFGRVGGQMGGMTIEAQLARIRDAEADILREAQIQVRDVFGQISRSVAELDAAASAAGAPIAQLSETIGQMTNIAQLLADGVRFADSDFQKSATGSNALLVSQAAALAAQVLTTQEASRIAKELAQDAAFSGVGATGLRSASLLLDGITAFDPKSFANSFMRLNDALNKGAINQEQYVSLYNKGLDIFEGLNDAAGGAANALETLRNQLKLDEQLSPLSFAQRRAEAERQFGIAKDENTLRTLLGLDQQASGSEFEYRRDFANRFGQMEQPESRPRLQIDSSEINERLDTLTAAVRSLQNTNSKENQAIFSTTREGTDVLVDAQSGKVPLATQGA